jgi:hypothetical protein
MRDPAPARPEALANAVAATLVLVGFVLVLALRRDEAGPGEPAWTLAGPAASLLLFGVLAARPPAQLRYAGRWRTDRYHRM